MICIIGEHAETHENIIALVLVLAELKSILYNDKY